MTLYLFHFIDATGTVVHRHSLQLPTNSAAIKLGHHMLAERNRDHAVEVWHRNHLVHSESRRRAAG